jgi:hypothetical protein
VASALSYLLITFIPIFVCLSAIAFAYLVSATIYALIVVILYTELALKEIRRLI